MTTDTTPVLDLHPVTAADLLDVHLNAAALEDDAGTSMADALLATVAAELRRANDLAVVNAHRLDLRLQALTVAIQQIAREH